MKKVLITGVAGFIGFHLTRLLLKSGYEVIGIDNINDYYDPNLKLIRLEELGINSKLLIENKPIEGQIVFHKTDLKDKEGIFNLFEKYKFDYVVNLAAQAGVRYSLENPQF